MEKVCVILGAGASHDVDSGSPPVHPDWKPPLTGELFNTKDHAEYANVMSLYPGAQFLSAYLASLGEFGLEQELTKRAADPKTQEKFKHVPPYLRDLLASCSYRYTPQPGGYIGLVIDLLGRWPHEVLFLVLNYDNLLEQALNEFDQTDYPFQNMNNYVPLDRRAKVVKLHGSVNWYISIGPKKESWQNLVSARDISQKPPDNEIIIETRKSAILEPVCQLIEGENHVYPVLTAPLAGKGITDMVCPSSHVKAAKEFLRDCRKFLIIGTGGLDEDLLSLLSSSVSHQKNMYINIVCGDQKQGMETLKRFQKRVRAFNSTMNMLYMPLHEVSASVINAGFKKYVSSPAFEDFAKGA